MPAARDGPLGAARARSSRRSMSSVGIPPGRSSCGGSTVQSTIVDSTPIGLGPPSRITSRAGSSDGPRSARTWAAVVGLTRPKRFADGAAIATPVVASSCCVSGWAGARTPTVSRPPVTTSGTRDERGSSSVSGPGQQAAASTAATAGMSTAQSSSQSGSMWTISGWSVGRSLTAKIRGHRVGVRRVGAEAVHRLGRDGDESASAQPGGGDGDVRRDQLRQGRPRGTRARRR